MILQSSGVNNPWSFVEPTEAFRRTLKLAALLGCPTSGSKQDVILCLTKKPAEEILNKEMGVANVGLVRITACPCATWLKAFLSI